jgi:hypothetical protein
MNDLVLNSAEKHLTLYRSMCSAIGVCHRVDECKDIIDKSVALAAYYKQIEDDKTVQMFYEVRLRAWRRIGKLISAVDVSKCETVAARCKVIRAAFDEQAMRGISDSRISQILKLSAVSDSDFEHAIAQQLSTGSVDELLRHTPEFQEQLRKNAERQEQIAKTARERQPTPREIEDAEAEERELRHYRELELASEAAMKEVGITLERKDRARMKQVVFLIKDDVHTVLRQAAFDQKITMQEVLRRGLKMWLIAHGYTFPE